MASQLDTLVQTAAALVANGKGLLAADETVATLGRRFAAHGIASTPATRRDYREMLLATPGIGDFLSGVILQDETMRQERATGGSLLELATRVGIVGIKVDAGAEALAGHRGERVTDGLDGLRSRLVEYRRLGARFAKWRAVFAVSATTPSAACISANAHGLARYAALCQEQGLVPIVEPEVLMDGPHSIERCADVTGEVLRAVFWQLVEQGVQLEGMLLKPNMIVPGEDAPVGADVGEVAQATLRCMRRHVPAAVPGIVFLSGGQPDVLATRHLDAINRDPGPHPWKLTFSFARALQDAPLEIWGGRAENVEDAQRAFLHRARCNSLAARGEYSAADDERLVEPTVLVGGELRT